MIWSKCRLAGAPGWWANATNSMFSTTFCTSLPYPTVASEPLEVGSINPPRASAANRIIYSLHKSKATPAVPCIYLSFAYLFRKLLAQPVLLARVGDQENGARLHISQIQRGIRVIRIKKSAATIARNWVYLWKIILYFCNGA